MTPCFVHADYRVVVLLMTVFAAGMVFGRIVGSR